jgi:hypothetical protein
LADAVQRGDGLGDERHRPALAGLRGARLGVGWGGGGCVAAHPDGFAGEVHVAPAQGAQLAEAQAGVGGQAHDVGPHRATLLHGGERARVDFAVDPAGDLAVGDDGDGAGDVLDLGGLQDVEVGVGARLGDDLDVVDDVLGDPALLAGVLEDAAQDDDAAADALLAELAAQQPPLVGGTRALVILRRSSSRANSSTNSRPTMTR